MAVKEMEGGAWRRLSAATSMGEVVAESAHPMSQMITYEGEGHALHLFDTHKALELKIAAWLTEVLYSSL